MSDDLLTYAEAAERLNLTVEAVRLRALRGRWHKTIGNDKRPRIRLPEGWSNDVQTTVERRERKPRNDGRTTVERAIVTALESHIKTLQADVEALKEQLVASSGREARLVADLAAEQAKMAQALQAFSDLATSFDALAAARSRPWWRRLVGGRG